MKRSAAFGSCLVLVLAVFFVPAPGLAREHRVRAGQSLARIARRYRVSVQDLRAANRLRSANLRPGQVLRIPDPGELYVRRGETLSHVARRANVSVSELRRANRLRRGRALQVGQRLVVPGFQRSEPRDYGEPEVPGRITIQRRDVRETLQLVDAEGRVVEANLPALGRMMRRLDDDPLRMPHPRLALLLARLSDHFGGRTLQVVSGFREAGGYTRETSRHTRGRALDLRIRGVDNRAIWERCRRFDHAGCGYYPRSTFVHVDARLVRTQWVDWSRPGQRARYGTLRGPARRAQRRRMARPRRQGDIPLTIEVVRADGSVYAFEDSAAVDEHRADEEEEAERTRPREANPPPRSMPRPGPVF